ncbi:MAG: CopD family protein [Anaerolineaceae bacterium]|nr:CopD family protein [Anaerolineaceae bacterium]
MTAPGWVLLLSYWLHMIATIVWIGGLAALTLYVLPTAQRELQSQSYSEFLEKIQNRLQSIGWFSLVILAVTGLFQLSSSPAYKGFLVIQTQWAWAILLKHLVIVIMVAISAYVSLWLSPNVARLTFLQTKRALKNNGLLERLQSRQLIFMRINLAIGVIILALTAWARTSV